MTGLARHRCALAQPSNLGLIRPLADFGGAFAGNNPIFFFALFAYFVANSLL